MALPRTYPVNDRQNLLALSMITKNVLEKSSFSQKYKKHIVQCTLSKKEKGYFEHKLCEKRQTPSTFGSLYYYASFSNHI